jgi:1-acyl-sn-glycerol-3-phosphate acyltransferase
MLKRGYFFCAALMSWIFFGVCALGFNLLCALLLPVPGRSRCAPVIAGIIRRYFALWLGWMRVAGLIRVNWHGFAAETVRSPAVFVANHPGLIDAVFLLSRLPGAVCVFKSKLLRNPFLAPAAIMAGYPMGDAGPDFVRAAVRSLAAGRTLLIFPEGTRTATGTVLNPIKPGFALIAARAGVPVQLITIRADGELLPREREWWRFTPQFPITVEISADRRLTIPSDHDAHETAAWVEDRLMAVLTRPCTPAPV